MGLCFFAWCWWPRESMLWGSSMLSEFRTALWKVLTLWYCVKVKQRYQYLKISLILDESGCFLIKYHCSYSQLKSQHNHDHKSPTILAYIPEQSKFRMTQFYKMPIIYTGLLLPRLSQVILEKSYINLLRLMKMRFLFLKVQAERLKLTTSPLDSQYFFGYQILETHSYANARHSKANSGLDR